MAALMNMDIAGINFNISCRDSIILQDFPSIYQPFIKKTASDSASITFNIRLELHDIPDTGNMKKIFDTDDSWSMYKDDNDYIIALNPPALKKQIVWLARFNESFSETVVYCSDLLKRETDSGIKVLSPVLYPLDQLLLIHILAQNQGALIHAAGIELYGKGYIFPGRSGAGKSTISLQFGKRKHFGLLSDDRIAVRKVNNTLIVYGTPWAGEAGIADNSSSPLCGIFFIRQGAENIIKELQPKEALERLIPVTSIPWYDEEIMTKVLLFCEYMVSGVPAYDLFFKPDSEVVDVLEKYLST
jgi:hypothetical protein